VVITRDSIAAVTCFGRDVRHALDVRPQAEWDAVHRLIASGLNDCAVARHRHPAPDGQGLAPPRFEWIGKGSPEQLPAV